MIRFRLSAKRSRPLDYLTVRNSTPKETIVTPRRRARLKHTITQRSNGGVLLGPCAARVCGDKAVSRYDKRQAELLAKADS